MNFAQSIFFSLYGAAWKGAFPLLKRHKRLKEGFAERLAPPGWPWPMEAAVPQCSGPCRPEARPDAMETPSRVCLPSSSPLRVWIQAASGGEAWLTHSLVPALLRALPQKNGASPQFLCTTCTRQGLDVLEKLADRLNTPHGPPTLLPRYLPLDHPAIMLRAVKAAAPDALIILETELWPGLLLAAKKTQTPVFLLNARMREKSLKAYARFASLWKELAPKNILAISRDDAARFAALFAPPAATGVMNNIKFDRLCDSQEAAVNMPESGIRALRGIAPEVLLAVFGSVREEEEDILLPVLVRLRDTAPTFPYPLAVAVAPRHMHRVNAWRDKLLATGLTVRLASESARTGGKELPAQGSAPEHGPAVVYLWDVFGELQTLYGAADAAFVGGSLAPLGGQNFLEAAALGLCPLVGPHLDNFRWAGEELFTLGLAGQVASPQELAAALTATLRERASFFASHGLSQQSAATEFIAAREKAAREKREAFKHWLAPRLGGTGQAATLVAKALRTASQ